MPPKPIAIKCWLDNSIFFVRNEHSKSKYTHKLEYLVPFFQNFLQEIDMPPKPLAINYRAAHYHYFISKQ